MKRIAIIPARGGSKRIPRKNIKDFLGKPIIAYSIHTAWESELFDEVLVSTDDREIADIAIHYGAIAPFQRSAENSTDFASTADVLLEVLEDCKRVGDTYQEACCLYATAPFVTAKRLRQAHRLFEKKGFDTVFSATRFSYPIQRALRQTKGKRVEMFWPENQSKRSQDLEPAYHDAGQFYWFRPEALAREKRLFTPNSAILEVPQAEVQDIDEPEDWEIAEIKYQILRKK